MAKSAIFFFVSFFATISTIPSAFALEENGVIEMPFTDNPPSIDGQWTTTDEWKDAGSVYVEYESYGNNNQMYILAKHDREYIYIMQDVISFQYEPFDSDRSTWFLSSICFDIDSDGGNEMGSNDFCFDLNQRYEYGKNSNDIPYDEVSVRNNQGKVSTPRGYDIKWWFTSKNDPYEEGRDHIVIEMKIPIIFLHKSDKYGFATSFYGGSLVGPLAGVSVDHQVAWPLSSKQYPSSWGTIMASSNTITAPPIPVISVSEKSLSFGTIAISEKSTTKTVTIKNLGTSSLKINNIRTSGEFSINAKTPADVSPGQSMTFDVYFVPITLGEKSGIVTVLSNDISIPSYTISVEGKGVEKGQFGGGCLIATATFGSELAPQVQFLREIRDTTVLSTASGTSFMTAFNTFYYLFSPTVADLERQNPVFKESVKISITPLLSSLSLLQYVDIDSEAEMLGYGIGVILLNIGMYFVAPVSIIIILRRKKS